MASTPPYVLWFRDLGREARSLVGGKNASLGELMQAGVRVPSGFALTCHAYESFVEAGGLRRAIDAALAGVDPTEETALEAASQHLREMIEATPLPDDVETALLASYRALAEEAGAREVPVAVRSSATMEDSVEASFAGLQDTYLWVHGERSLARHTLRCWSSLYTPQAISYRARLGLPRDLPSMSVGVQRMVDARAAGVMFTLNPLNGDLSKIVIEASWGLGLSVVGGEVMPDRYWVDKVTLEVIQRTVSAKTTRYLPAKGGGVVRAEVPPEEREVPCLSEEEVMELALIGKSIEKSCGSPRDIEWAIDGGLPFPDNVLMLQSRPETVWSRRQPGPLVAPKATALEYVVDAMVSRLRSTPRQ